MRFYRFLIFIVSNYKFILTYINLKIEAPMAVNFYVLKTIFYL